MSVDAETRRPRRPPVPEGTGALPNLIVIGAQKCGTSSLHRYLDLHPQVAMSRPKELNYFVATINWPKGVDWYARHFRADAPVRGEASVNYTNLPWSEGAAERMHDLVPEARLIYMVRDPIERLVSQYIQLVAMGFERRPISEAVSEEGGNRGLVARSLYATQLEPFLRLFGRERIHVEAQEDLLYDRAATMRRVFAFAGVDPDFSAPGFERMWEVSAGKDRKYRAALRISRRLGRHRWARLPTPLRWAVERTAYRPLRGGIERPSLGDGVRERLVERFAPEAARLREIAAHDFPGWSV